MAWIEGERVSRVGAGVIERIERLWAGGQGSVLLPRGRQSTDRQRSEPPCSFPAARARTKRALVPASSPTHPLSQELLDATGRVQDGELVEAVAIDIAVGMKAAVIDEKLQRKLCVASARTGLDNYQKS